MPLPNLRDLYLNGNPINNFILPNMLLNQVNLQSLHLSQTQLTNLTLKIRHLKDLSLLDISHNWIHCLYTSEIREINAIIHYRLRRGKVFELNLSHNPLLCSCSCLQFYLWMRKARTYIAFTDLNSYRCTFDNGRKANLSDLNLIVDILRSQCLSTDWSPVIKTTTAILILSHTV